MCDDRLMSRLPAVADGDSAEPVVEREKSYGVDRRGSKCRWPVFSLEGLGVSGIFNLEEIILVGQDRTPRDAFESVGVLLDGNRGHWVALEDQAKDHTDTPPDRVGN